MSLCKSGVTSMPATLHPVDAADHIDKEEASPSAFYSYTTVTFLLSSCCMRMAAYNHDALMRSNPDILVNVKKAIYIERRKYQL